MRLPLLVPLLAALTLPSAADAWSAPAHRLVADLAESRLSPEAKKLVHDILGNRSLSSISTWADEQGNRATKAWHYVNVPFSASAYDPARDCPRGDCVVAAIERSAAALGSGTSDLERADALRWLVHLVADVHQPLHAGDGRDRGGNDLEVRIAHRRDPVTFHHVWDTEVVQPLLGRRTPREAARAIAARIAPGDAAAWTRTLAPAAWADESAALARRIYGALGLEPRAGSAIVLPRDYARRQRPVAEERLAAAAVRLAALLDRIAAERAGAGGR